MLMIRRDVPFFFPFAQGNGTDKAKIDATRHGHRSYSTKPGERRHNRKTLDIAGAMSTERPERLRPVETEVDKGRTSNHSRLDKSMWSRTRLKGAARSRLRARQILSFVPVYNNLLQTEPAWFLNTIRSEIDAARCFTLSEVTSGLSSGPKHKNKNKRVCYDITFLQGFFPSSIPFLF